MPDMLVSWQHVNRTRTAGVCHVERLGISVTIRRWQLKNWKDDPDRRSSVVRIPTLKGNSYGFGLGQQAAVREASMFGDYPKRGRRLWLFLALVVALGLIGTALMLHSVNQG
jgi:hypothetical protein